MRVSTMMAQLISTATAISGLTLTSFSPNGLPRFGYPANLSPRANGRYSAMPGPWIGATVRIEFHGYGYTTVSLTQDGPHDSFLWDDIWHNREGKVVALNHNDHKEYADVWVNWDGLYSDGGTWGWEELTLIIPQTVIHSWLGQESALWTPFHPTK